MEEAHIPYVELEALDGSEALVPVYILRLRYIPELEVAIADTRQRVGELSAGERRIFVEVKRWRAHLETLDFRTRELDQQAERQRSQLLTLVHEAGAAVCLLKESALELRKIAVGLPKDRSLVDRIVKSSEDLIGIFGALRLVETPGESGFGSHS